MNDLKHTLEKAIESLAEAARKEATALDAMQRSQAALNLAYALEVFDNVR